jgi:hypothetical protein
VCTCTTVCFNWTSREDWGHAAFASFSFCLPRRRPHRIPILGPPKYQCWAWRIASCCLCVPSLSDQSCGMPRDCSQRCHGQPSTENGPNAAILVAKRCSLDSGRAAEAAAGEGKFRVRHCHQWQGAIQYRSATAQKFGYRFDNTHVACDICVSTSYR